LESGPDTKKVIDLFANPPPGLSPMDIVLDLYRRTNDEAAKQLESLSPLPSVVFFHQAVYSVAAVAQKHGFKAIEVSFAPWVQTGAIPNYTKMEAIKKENWDNKLRNVVSNIRGIESGWGVIGRPSISPSRTERGFKECPAIGEGFVRRATGIPFLQAYSPSVLPIEDLSEEDGVYQTGYWIHDPPYSPSSELEDFLSKKPQPIYIGFGSMATTDKPKLVETIIESLRETGQRALLYVGWAGLETEKDKIEKNQDIIFLVSDTPHAWLFPHVSAVIHHGGAGTTAAGLRAGKATWIVHHGFDQPLWGQRVFHLGIGPKPISSTELESENLTEAIKELVLNQEMRKKADEIGEKIRKEGGLSRAVDVMRDVLEGNISQFGKGQDLENEKGYEDLWGSKPTPEALSVLSRSYLQQGSPHIALGYVRYFIDLFPSSSSSPSPWSQEVISDVVAALISLFPERREEWERMGEKWDGEESVQKLATLLDELAEK